MNRNYEVLKIDLHDRVPATVIDYQVRGFKFWRLRSAIWELDNSGGAVTAGTQIAVLQPLGALAADTYYMRRGGLEVVNGEIGYNTAAINVIDFQVDITGIGRYGTMALPDIWFNQDYTIRYQALNGDAASLMQNGCLWLDIIR